MAASDPVSAALDQVRVPVRAPLRWKESKHFVDGGPGFAGYHCMLRNEDVPEGFTSESWKTVDLNKPKSWPWPSVGGAPFPEERV